MFYMIRDYGTGLAARDAAERELGAIIAAGGDGRIEKIRHPRGDYVIGYKVHEDREILPADVQGLVGDIKFHRYE